MTSPTVRKSCRFTTINNHKLTQVQWTLITAKNQFFFSEGTPLLCRKSRHRHRHRLRRRHLYISHPSGVAARVASGGTKSRGTKSQSISSPFAHSFAHPFVWCDIADLGVSGRDKNEVDNHRYGPLATLLTLQRV